MRQLGGKGAVLTGPDVRPSPFTVFWDRYVASENVIAVVGGALVVGAAVAFFKFASATDPDTWVPVVVLLALTIISVPICFWVARSPRDVRLRRLLLLSFCLKMLAVGPRYYMLEVYYDGEGDALRYDRAGDYLVQNMGEGKFSIEGSELVSFPSTTQFVGYVTGTLYLVFGTSYLGGFFVFSWLAWLGLLMLFRAFQVAFPNAPPYRAAILILMWPSSVFWPSSIGKDALMVFCVGLMTLGAARLLTGRGRGFGILWIALASLFMMQVRPHLVLISAIALAGSQLAGSVDAAKGKRSVVIRIVILVAIVPLAVTGFSRIDSLGGQAEGENLFESLDTTVARTEIGGSAFAAVPVRTPLDLPFATVSVIYRPFIFEARSVPAAISALEGAVLLALTVASWRWIGRIIPVVTRTAFGAFCGLYVMAFVIAFSNIANAGILSRQRVQMYAVLMIVVAAAYETHRVHQRELEEAAADDGAADGARGALASVGGPGQPAAALRATNPDPLPGRIPVS